MPKGDKYIDLTKEEPEINAIDRCKYDIPIDMALDAVQKFYAKLNEDEHARYRSWEYCYAFFSKNNVNPDKDTIDFLSLHLAWYLASWGMLRGGAFLLQKDYKVHIPVVRLLVAEENRNLYHLTIDDYMNNEILNQVINISNQIIDIYKVVTKSDAFEQGRKASDTLVTKILLGTMGCVPAYDRYFKKGLNKSNVSTTVFNAKSLKKIAMYYKKNFNSFENLRNKIHVENKVYPIMKIMDMCFWQLGVDIEKLKIQ